jgi:Spy/CpxP family protein refolding chaperone
MKQIKDVTKAQIEAVLTPEQRVQWQTAKQNGQKMRQVFASLNLTDAQKTRIEEIKNQSKEQMKAILTPEQRQQLEQDR